ncbi:MAG: hypothetical protein HY316_07370 [Acidobacteria bacterium]|nr:hypothetical protein [Acidobacteriota bacterium]
MSNFASFEHLLQIWALPILTVVLIIVTAYYAIKTAGILRETARLAKETNRMAEETAALASTSLKAYKATVVPDVEFMPYDPEPRPQMQHLGIQMRNKGRYPLRWIAIKALVELTENSAVTEEIVERVDKQVIAQQVERGALYFDHRKHRIRYHFIEVDDIAGERHQIAVQWANGW